MITLEIHNSTGNVVRQKLTKSQPLSIGKHQSNDLQVDEDGVAPMHCRISWNKTAYEVTAASTDGLDVNGTIVSHWLLAPGDTIRIGSVDVKVVGENGPANKPSKSKKTDNVDLVPMDESDLQPMEEDSDPDVEYLLETDARSAKQRGPKPRKRRPSPMDDVLDMSDDNDDEDQEDTDVSGRPMLARSRTFTANDAAADKPVTDSEGETEEKVSAADRLKARMARNAKRPGEQSSVRSPLVITLVILAAVLSLAGGIFWFWNNRNLEVKTLERAQKQWDEGQYRQADTTLAGTEVVGEDGKKIISEATGDPITTGGFLNDFPSSTRRIEAATMLGRIRIEAKIKGSTPKWEEGLKELKTFIIRRRDDEDFPDLHEIIREYAYEISYGAVETSEHRAVKSNKLPRKDRTTVLEYCEKLIDLSIEAEKILVRYSPTESPPVEMQKKIRQQRLKAQAAIAKAGVFYDVLNTIEKALTNKKPKQALESRRKLLDRYPVLLNDRELKQVMARTLQVEIDSIRTSDVKRDGIDVAHIVPFPAPLSFTLHPRTTSDAVSEGRTVYCIGMDCCFGIDSVTGDTVWRRVVGLDLPFHPMSVDSSVGPALLMYDTYYGELILLERKTGKLIWRQTLDSDISGPPVTHQSDIFIPTESGKLFRVALSNGRVDAELRFSQKILSLALVNKEENLIVAGDEAVLYTLTLRPFKCVAVTDIGHKPGSITAPLLPMGTLLLMCENDTLDSCLLRVFDTTDSKSLKQVAFAKIGGQVRDTAILRGKQLFVPSSGQRIFAYTVSDDPNQNTLTAVAPFDLEFKYDGPMFLTAGPDDQVWMASSSLRRFHLTTESLVMDPKQVAVGLSLQPIQDLGKNLYAGRLMPGTGASVLSQVDGAKMVSQWMTVTGSQILACDANGESTGVCFTSVGDCYFINQNDLLGGKFKYRPALQLKIPATMESPLRAVRLGDGNYAIHCGLPKPQMWVVNPDGQLIRTFMLDAPLEADPVSIAAGVVLPLPGKLSLNRSSGRVVKDLIVAVEQGKKRKWKFLATLGKNQLVALDSENSLARIEFQTQQNVDSLREVDTAELKTPVNQQMSVTDGKILIGDSVGNLSILDGANLDTLATAKLTGPVSNTVWSVGNRVFVESSEKELSCFELGATLIKKWTVQLGNDGLADKPIVKDGFVIAVKRNGGVVSIDVVTGELKKELQLGQPVNLGPREIAGMLVVGTIDGSLFRIESIIALSKQ